MYSDINSPFAASCPCFVSEETYDEVPSFVPSPSFPIFSSLRGGMVSFSLNPTNISLYLLYAICYVSANG